MYDLYSKFNIEQHKSHYMHYLEVVIFPNGEVEYAVPSHQEKLISICCETLNVTRDELNSMCPQEYYFDFMTWLCTMSGCVSVWTNGIIKSDKNPITDKQYQTLCVLSENNVYEGEIRR